MRLGKEVKELNEEMDRVWVRWNVNKGKMDVNMKWVGRLEKRVDELMDKVEEEESLRLEKEVGWLYIRLGLMRIEIREEVKG